MRRFGFLVLLISLLVIPSFKSSAFAPKPHITAIVAVEEPLEDMLHRVEKALPNLKITHTYDTVFDGFAVKGSIKDITSLSTISGVKRVDTPVTYKVAIDESVPFIGGDAVRGLFDKEDKRLTGKGVTVGVIDTGVDYNHPDLKANYQGGFDLIDQDHDPMETKADQLSTFHGTHVAGIIAANGKVKGVAPDAKIVAYRALGPGGVGTSEQVIAAIEKAVKDGIDIINLSLGNTINGPDWPTSEALDKAVEKGVIAVTSSGNSGPNLWTVGSPGTSSKAISVGASYPPVKIPIVKTIFQDRLIPLQPMQGGPGWDLKRSTKLVVGGLGKPEELNDVKNKVVLIERGEIPFTVKALSAEAAGASAVLIYNNEKGAFAGMLEGEINIPVAAITQEDGLWLKERITQGDDYLDTTFKVVQDQIAGFSSRGPVTHTWMIKPDVVAPGVSIHSTVPAGYLALQGTSMAAPHVAGACALIKQAHPEWTPEQVKAALMNTAKVLVQSNGEPFSPYEQGTGRIDLSRAVRTDSLIYPGSFTFGLVTDKELRTEREVTVTIENHSKKTKKYTFDQPSFKSGIQWDIPSTFVLKAGEKRNVTFRFDINPRFLDSGIHTGLLNINDGSHNMQLPYSYVINEPDYPRLMGFDFKPGEQPNTFEYEVYLPRGADEFGIILLDPQTMTLVDVLDRATEVDRGLYKRILSKDEVPAAGIYKAIIYANKSGQEDVYYSDITIGEEVVSP